MNELVNLDQYAFGESVSGAFNSNDVLNLYKAMSAGDITGAQTWNLTDASGAPLKVESLENTMKILVNSMKQIPFITKIAKKPATNTIEEYVQLMSYGDLDGGFTSEGELPENSDSTYRRKAQHIKYMGLVGGVTLPMQLVNTGAGVSNMMAQESRNKSMAIMNMMERALPFADSAIVPDNFNGFFAQHRTETEYANYDQYMNSQHVIDCRGRILTDEVVERGSETITENFGLASTLISHPAVFSAYNQRYYDKKFIRPVPSDVRDGVFGQRVNEIWTQNGGIEIMQSNMFRRTPGPKTATTAATSPKAPAAPTSVTSAATASTMSKFVGGEDYIYAVAAKNKYGESALTFVDGGALVATAAGQGIDLTITAGTGAYTPTGYAIYRTEPDPTGTYTTVNMYKLFEVSVASVTSGYDGAAAGAVRDNDRFMANTDEAMMVEWDSEQVLALKQLAPLMKLNLAVTAPINRFMVLLYSTPILYAPRKMVRYINIGKKLV